MVKNSKISRINIDYFDGVNGAVASNIAKKTELMHAENVRSRTIGTIEKREGETAFGSGITPIKNYGVFSFAIPSSTGRGLYRISKVGSTTSIYYLNSSNVWTALTSGGTNLVVGVDIFMNYLINVEDFVPIVEDVIPNNHNFDINIFDRVFIKEGYNSGALDTYILDAFDYTIAEECFFLVNYNNASRYITSNGTTVVTSSNSTGHLFNCPKANVINYYKGKLYVADFTYTNIRYRTSVLRSSPPLGIVALVSADLAAPADTTISITDNKYIYTDASNRNLEVYRGPNKVATITVSSVQESTIILTGGATYEVGFTTILASDELWANGTFSGAKQFRWVNNPSASGINAKDYDMFRIGGPGNEEIKMMVNIGNVMLIASNSGLSVWNDVVLQNIETDYGCISRKGYVKNSGSLYFIHYTGIFKTTGAEMPQKISDKVQKYFDGSTKSGLENSVAGKKGKSVFFTLGTVTLYNPDGSTDKTLSNVMVEHNILQDNWYIHTGISAVDMTTWVEETNVDRCMLAGGSLDMSVLEFLSGNTDNSREIPMRADTSNLMLGTTFERSSKPLEIVIETERGSGLKTFISTDMGQWYEIDGESAKGCTLLKVVGIDGAVGNPPRCRNIRLSLRENSKRVCKVSKMAINYLISNEEDAIQTDYE